MVKSGLKRTKGDGDGSEMVFSVVRAAAPGGASEGGVATAAGRESWERVATTMLSGRRYRFATASSSSGVHVSDVSKSSFSVS